ncbi:WxL domain-containing protein [Enterococcus sp. BWB1-3]|uniref:WxL domain-containing protein n=1 Tax=unclassified Enterococcus TaxID=2608891 RepID=UPI001924FF60|nr:MULTISPECIES: WxL domain-containing protein [unclassified Enterococcus]MBL1231079.1 WxL domain-containing protein [Enterococcus sp. BWB1-3]MCB5952575.1 WxL domain-containing protein [Enterococcus sp. BWT-B8]MCB5953912.1 WxL domain-containing protein [Enterococcus sp. CWB-B31]
MKLRKLCAVALVATIGAATVGSAAASADEKSLDSRGTVEVVGGKIDPSGPDNIVDPENPEGPGIDPETPGVIPNPEEISKGIIAVSDLDFGQITVGTTSANAAALELLDGTNTRGNIVSFGDVTGSYTGYTITGELTSQFTNGTTTLDGASITYTNPLLASSGTGTIAAAVPASVVLSTEEGAQTFVSAAAGEGSGLWTLEFGQSATSEAGTPGTDANSVQLAIPASVASAMTLDTYNATVTWTMGATA